MLNVTHSAQTESRRDRSQNATADFHIHRHFKSFGNSRDTEILEIWKYGNPAILKLCMFAVRHVCMGVFMYTCLCVCSCQTYMGVYLLCLLYLHLDCIHRQIY